ncbi:MAG: alkylphosphonate utilization protein [Verrucomicrobia bacterium]|nr:alkylphosphonate utilization protein [Verrucomicrobiota bacterium]
MKETACPMCSMTDLMTHPDKVECMTCGHEWADSAESAPEGLQERVVKDANGNVLADGDSVTLLKDLKLKGSSQVIKGGTKVKGIRLVDGDHEISCKIEGSAIGLKACFVKKA